MSSAVADNALLVSPRSPISTRRPSFARKRLTTVIWAIRRLLMHIQLKAFPVRRATLVTLRIGIRPEAGVHSRLQEYRHTIHRSQGRKARFGR